MGHLILTSPCEIGIITAPFIDDKTEIQRFFYCFFNIPQITQLLRGGIRI